MHRSTQEVLDAHLAAFGPGADIETVLADYADDAVVMTVKRTFRGRDAIRSFYADLFARVPTEVWALWEVTRTNVEGEVAMLTWRLPPAVDFATDTLVVRDGRIAYQTMASVLGSS